MMNNVYVKAILMIGLICYGAYLLFTAMKQFYKHIKAKKEFIKKEKGKYVAEKSYVLWMLLYFAGAVVGVISTFYQIQLEEYVIASAFVFVTLCLIAMGLDAIIKRQALFAEDGFFFENDFYRYRSVTRVKRKNSFIGGYTMYVLNKGEIGIATKTGEMLETQLKQYKKNKKNK